MRAFVTVNLSAIRHNLALVKKELDQSGISLAVVTKMHRADPVICRTLIEGGIKALADSRIENLASLDGLDAEKWLIRIPSPSIAADVVRYADLSLNSDPFVIEALSREAVRQKKMHRIVLMWDLGDLREGFFQYDDLLAAAKKAISLDGILLDGIGTNLSCYGGVLPTAENLETLAAVAHRLRCDTGSPIPIVSGGNSTSYSLLLAEGLPSGITNLRIGDTIYIGRDMIMRTDLPEYRQDCFMLTAEVAEVREKPSVPIGDIGYAALNMKPVFEDRGLRKRAILSVGRQDCDTDMAAADGCSFILGASSDHLLVDVTDSPVAIKPGDRISFHMKYTSIMRAFTSPYVDILYTEDGK